MSESIFQHPLNPEEPSQPNDRSNRQPSSQTPPTPPEPASFDMQAPEAASVSPSAASAPAAPSRVPVLPRYLQTGAFKTFSLIQFIRGLMMLIAGSLCIILLLVMGIAATAAEASSGVSLLVTFFLSGIIFVPTFFSFRLGLAVLKLRKGDSNSGYTIHSILTFYRVLLIILIVLIGILFIILSASLNTVIPLLIAPIPIVILALNVRFYRGLSDDALAVSHDIYSSKPTHFTPCINVAGFAWFFAVIPLFNTLFQAMLSSGSTSIISLLEDLGINFRSFMSRSDYYELQNALSYTGISLFSALSAAFTFVSSVLIAICHRLLVRAHNSASNAGCHVREVYPASASAPGILVSILWLAVAIYVLPRISDISSIITALIKDYGSSHYYYHYSTSGLVLRLFSSFFSITFSVGAMLMCFSHLFGKAKTLFIVSLSLMLSDVLFGILFYILQGYTISSVLSCVFDLLMLASLLACVLLTRLRHELPPTAIRIIAPIAIFVFGIVSLALNPSFFRLLYMHCYVFSALVILNLNKKRVPDDVLIA